MKASLLVLAAVLFFGTQTADGRSGRKRRGALNLGSVVSCYTGKSVWDVFINYNGYGCYCGYGGKGTPLDEIDECCEEHDHCYEDAINPDECRGTLAYTVSPQYISRNCGTADTSVTCKPARGYRDKTIVIYDEDGDTFSPSAQLALKEGRAPANLISQFATSIECATGRSPILDYANYGCYCGIGGKGRPLDATDECCMMHDKCYEDTILNRQCSSMLDVMTRWYSYRSDGCRTPNVSFTCKEPRDYGLFERLLAGTNPTCANAVCECDRAAALCFYTAEFNPVYRMYNKLILCGKNVITSFLPENGPTGREPSVNPPPLPDQPTLNNAIPLKEMSQS